MPVSIMGDEVFGRHSSASVVRRCDADFSDSFEVCQGVEPLKEQRVAGLTGGIGQQETWDCLAKRWGT